MERKKKEEVNIESEIIETNTKEKEDTVLLRAIIKDRNEFDKVKIKGYLPIQDKLALIHNIIGMCMSENEDGLVINDYGFQYYALRIGIVENYSNIDFSEYTRSDAYNIMEEKDIIQNIIDCIKSEDIKFLNDTLNQEIYQKQCNSNSIDMIIVRKLDKWVSKIPSGEEFIKSIQIAMTTVDGFDPEKLKYVKSIYNTLSGNKN